jgi:hypothetical protein
MAMDLISSDDTDGVRDIVTRQDVDFRPSEVFVVDNSVAFGTPPFPNSSLTLQFATPDGFVLTTHLQAVYAPGTPNCAVTGISIAG